MYICIECYNRRGEKALLHDGEIIPCQFCDTAAMCFDIPIWELQHWRDVIAFEQKNMPR